MEADPVFVDTNVLVYATRPSVGQHMVSRPTLAFFWPHKLEVALSVRTG